MIGFCWPEESLYHGGVAGILWALIESFPDEIEEHFNVWVPGVIDGLLGACGDRGQKREDLFGRDRG